MVVDILLHIQVNTVWRRGRCAGSGLDMKIISRRQSGLGSDVFFSWIWELF